MNETDSSTHFFHEKAEISVSGEDVIAFIKSANDNSSEMQFLYFNETELYNISNSDVTSGEWREFCKPILDMLLMLILIVVMLAMGCEITWKNLLHHIKKPIGLCIGIFSQFGIMPLSAFCILLISDISGLHATGVLLISCCPGGVLSNTFTYFCEGNLPLSVAMTCASTVIAMGMMPLNIWLYGRRFESEDLIIPYEKMAMSLISVTSPVIVGMLIKWKFPRIAAFIGKVGGYFSLLIMFVCIGMEIVLFPNMFVGIPFKLYAVILTLPIIGMTLGYGLATIMKQNKPIRKTIAIECGVQNVPVALTVIALSFPLEMQEDIVLLPWMYGFAMMSGCTVICLTYHFYTKRSKKSITDAHTKDILEKQDPLLGDSENKETANGIKIEIKPSSLKNGIGVSIADSCV